MQRYQYKGFLVRSCFLDVNYQWLMINSLLAVFVRKMYLFFEYIYTLKWHQQLLCALLKDKEGPVYYTGTIVWLIITCGYKEPGYRQPLCCSSTPVIYRQTSDISHIFVGNKTVDHSNVVGASPVGAAPTTFSFSTQHLALMDWAKITARRDDKHIQFWIICVLY